MDLLADQAVLLADGGGKVKTEPQPITGVANIAHFLNAIEANTLASDWVRLTELNGYPGLIIDRPVGISHVVTFDFANGKIRAVYVMANPDKIAHLNPIQ